MRPIISGTPGSQWLAIGIVVAAAVTLSACNAVSGLGRDVEAAGEAVTETAEDAKN